MSTVELRQVTAGAWDRLVAMLADHLRELEPYELAWDRPPGAEEYASAFDDDPDGQDIEWIIAAGARAGFLVTRVVPDWPDETRAVGEVLECYVAPPYRRRGVARAAIEVWLARMREQGVAQVEASVLTPNAPALAFWRRLGFETRAVQTVRRP